MSKFAALLMTLSAGLITTNAFALEIENHTYEKSRGESGDPKVVPVIGIQPEDADCFQKQKPILNAWLQKSEVQKTIGTLDLLKIHMAFIAAKKPDLSVTAEDFEKGVLLPAGDFVVRHRHQGNGKCEPSSDKDLDDSLAAFVVKNHSGGALPAPASAKVETSTRSKQTAGEAALFSRKAKRQNPAAR